MGTVFCMARAPKLLQPLDRAAAHVLAEAVEAAGLSRRRLAEATGLSANRIGIVLRQEEPPATVGELALLADAVGMAASAVVRTAEDAVSQGDYTLAAYDDDTLVPELEAQVDEP